MRTATARKLTGPQMVLTGVLGVMPLFQTYSIKGIFQTPYLAFFSLFFVCVFFNITVNQLINMYSFPVLEE